ncbi:hypothetical protein VTL71DRAFT_5216 [Oculimacula yallundae]|uniref:Heterokaryon incompatibility domain-containing protein n=1 Tax=Oculimacula yallundae TaxID=86028 RepID=A0ABR4C1M7_9HELO
MLGRRYLWIDMLCIIQDSKEDWQCEAALMGEVYRNGYCNLSAIAAEDGSVGIIFERQVAPTTVRAVVCTSEDREAKDVLLCDPRSWYAAIDRSPLLARGWVCQVRLSSLRNVHFGRGKIFWKCASLVACEDFPDGTPHWQGRYHHKHYVKLTGAELLRTRSASNTAELSPDEPSHPLSLWFHVVEWYSTCHLTFDSDKLVAIGGMAAASHHIFSANT